jgi:2-phosphosulfolactate phosphatase
MSCDVRVHFLPILLEPAELRGGVAVMIDLLRASTTIVHALSAGADAVIPCQTVEEAQTAAANLTSAKTVLGGERDGVRIDGFDFGNSPAEYTKESVSGKTVVFTTTNGTHALARCREAKRVLISGFVNLTAVAKELQASALPVHLVCAGTNGRVTGEDILFAGALADELQPDSMNDSTRIAIDDYNMNKDDLRQAVANSAGGRNVIQAGHEADIDRVLDRNRFDIVPEYSPDTNRIQPIQVVTKTNG